MKCLGLPVYGIREDQPEYDGEQHDQNKYDDNHRIREYIFQITPYRNNKKKNEQHPDYLRLRAIQKVKSQSINHCLLIVMKCYLHALI
jgi:hypothetical protein